LNGRSSTNDPTSGRLARLDELKLGRPPKPSNPRSNPGRLSLGRLIRSSVRLSLPQSRFSDSPPVEPVALGFDLNHCPRFGRLTSGHAGNSRA